MRNFNSGHFIYICSRLIIQRYEKKQDCLESILIDKMIAEIDKDFVGLIKQTITLIS